MDSTPTPTPTPTSTSMAVDSPRPSSPRTSRAVMAHLAAVLILTGVAAAFLAPVFSGNTFTAVGARRADNYPWAAFPAGGPAQPAQADQADLSYPWQHQADRALEQGTLPLWNPDTFAGGSPLLANGSSAMLWPPRLLVSLLPDQWAHDAYVAIHLVLWGLAMYTLLRGLGASWGAGVVAGVAWQLGTFNLGWVHLEVVAGMPLLLPLGLLMVLRMRDRRTWAAGVGGGLVIGAILLSGHLVWHLITLQVLAVVAGVTVVHTAIRERSLRGACWPFLPLATAVPAAAVLLVPTAVTLSGTPRAPFPEALVAQFVGNWRGLADLVRPPDVSPMTTTVLNVHLGFVGWAALGCAAIGLFARRPGAGAARGIIVAAIVVAHWAPAARLLHRLLPPFDVFYPYTRLHGWAAFGIVVAAGLGVDLLWRRLRAPGWAHVGWSLAVVALVVVQMVPLGRSLNPPFPERNSGTDTFDETPLITAAQALPPTDGVPALIAPITRDYENLRPVGPPMLWANHATLFELFTTSGYDSTLPAGAARVLRVAAGDSIEATRAGLVGAFVPLMEARRSNPTVLRRLGVTHLALVPELDPADPAIVRFGIDPTPVYRGPDGTIVALRDPEPTLRVVGRAEWTDEDTALRRLSDPAWRRDAVVLRTDDAPPDRATVTEGTTGRSGGGDASVGSGEAGAAGTARMTVRGLHGVAVSVRSGGSGGWLVLPVNADPGWTATVNGVDTPVGTGDVGRVVVPVPPGESTVELRYRPPYWPVGAAVTAATLLAFLFAVAVERRRGSRRRVGGGVGGAGREQQHEHR